MNHLITGADALQQLIGDFKAGKSPDLWRTHDSAWDAFELGMGLITVVAAPPKAGKTALTMQLVCDTLTRNPELTAYVANCEVSPQAMMQRLLARFSGVAVRDIRFARNDAATTKLLEEGAKRLCGCVDRLIFHRGRFALNEIQHACGQHASEHGGKSLFVVDYLQRLRLDSKDAASDRRIELEDTMSALRDMADSGLGIIVVSAVARQKGRGGSNYAGIGLASLRGSSELEYGADSIWLMHTGNDGNGANDAKDKDAAARPPVPDNVLVLECAANRHGDTETIPLVFDKPRMQFHIIKTGQP